MPPMSGIGPAKEKVQYLDFSNFSLILAKFSFWEEYWALGYNFKEFGNFPENS